MLPSLAHYSFYYYTGYSVPWATLKSCMTSDDGHFWQCHCCVLHGHSICFILLRRSIDCREVLYFIGAIHMGSHGSICVVMLPGITAARITALPKLVAASVPWLLGFGRSAGPTGGLLPELPETLPVCPFVESTKWV